MQGEINIRSIKMSDKKIDEARLFTEVFGDGDMFVDKNIEFLEVGDHFEVVGYNGSPKELIVPAWYEYKPVTVIRDGVFSGMTELEVVTLGDSLAVIGECAFSGCTALGRVNIPESVREIGEYAFSGCTALGSVTIPVGVVKIGERAFGACCDFVAYCRDKAKPEGWHDLWNSATGRVEWDTGAEFCAVFGSLFD